MSAKLEPGEMTMIPIDKIDVLNPRERNKLAFEEIVGNIKAIGLKKPITVARRPGPNGSERYLLICGERRKFVAVQKHQIHFSSRHQILRRFLDCESCRLWGCDIVASVGNHD